VIVREHPETASFRYLAPPAAAGLVALGLAMGLAGLAAIVAGRPIPVSWLVAGFAIPVIYLAGITAVGAALSRGVPAAVRARVPLVLGVMHMCWGAGFLTSPRRLHRGGKADTRVRSGEKKAEGAATVGGE
jgi:succinoglycan biosynthesis protein ExoA